MTRSLANKRTRHERKHHHSRERKFKSCIPWARIVKHTTKHRDPLLNTMFCFTEFLNGSYDHLVILDSDMIVSQTWRARLDDIVKTPGFRIGSLYHSNFHKIIAEHPSYYIKGTAGFAGMVFTREVMMFIRNSLGPVHTDWDVCDLLDRKNLFVCRPSAVAHIGINGQWNGPNYAHISKVFMYNVRVINFSPMHFFHTYC